ncbi:hypothetical protein [Geodermatophilus sp. URMC 65]
MRTLRQQSVDGGGDPVRVDLAVVVEQVVDVHAEPGEVAAVGHADAG